MPHIQRMLHTQRMPHIPHIPHIHRMLYTQHMPHINHMPHIPHIAHLLRFALRCFALLWFALPCVAPLCFALFCFALASLSFAWFCLALLLHSAGPALRRSSQQRFGSLRRFSNARQFPKTVHARAPVLFGSSSLLRAHGGEQLLSAPTISRWNRLGDVLGDRACYWALLSHARLRVGTVVRDGFSFANRCCELALVLELDCRVAPFCRALLGLALLRSCFALLRFALWLWSDCGAIMAWLWHWHSERHWFVIQSRFSYAGRIKD